MTSDNYEQLTTIIIETLNAHQRALFNLSKVQKTIAKLIVKKFKRYLSSQAPNPNGDDDFATPS